MFQPTLSCIMATKNRHQFLDHAVKLFLNQSYTNAELIIVEDGNTPYALPTPHERIRCMFLDSDVCLGEKLNLGIEHCRGALIQKLDDDDFYRADFLGETVSLITSFPSRPVIAGCDRFLMLSLQSGLLKDSGRGWLAGGTICFPRWMWVRKPFRPIPRAVDTAFIEDQDAVHIGLADPELYILARHGANTWTHRRDGRTVDEWLQDKKNYVKSLADCVPADSLKFYKEMMLDADARKRADGREEASPSN